MEHDTQLSTKLFINSFLWWPLIVSHIITIYLESGHETL